MLCAAILSHIPRLLFDLFADAEIGEDHVEQVLDIDPAGDAAEAAPGEAQILGAQLRQRRGERALERRRRTLQRLAMARAGQSGAAMS